MIIVSDTSPITNLAAIGQLNLLQQLYNTIIIPEAVYKEMAAVGKVVPGTVEVQTFSWIQTLSVGDSQRVADVVRDRDDIDLGEAEAIVLALEFNANLLLMDERRGRALAASYGLNVTGILGILLQAKSKGFISLVQPLLDRLIEEADFRVSSELYTNILKMAGE